MKTALRIFWHDLKQLVRNPFALIVVLGLIVLPSVYAWYSVAAMWSPYSHTDGLKVAVVNEDAGGSYKDKELRVGDMLVKGMGEDHSFDWQFVDSEQGKAGLDSGEYYAEFILPETFTEDFLSVLTGDLKNPTIEYWVNEKYNAVALEVTDAGAGVVDAVINRVFSGLIADALSDVVKDVAGDILSAESSASSQAQSGLEGAAKDVTNVENGLNGVSTSIDKWSESVDAAKKTVDGLTKSAPDLQKAIEDAEKVLAEVRTAANKVNSIYSSALAEGGPELSSLLSDLSKRVKQVSDDIASRQADITAAEEKAQKALDECAKLIKALVKLDPDSEDLADLQDQNEKLQTELAELEKANAALNDAASKASQATADLADDVGKATKKMKGRNDTFNSETMPKLESNLDSVAHAMGELDGALSGLGKQADQVKSLLDQLDEVLQHTKSAVGDTSESLGTVSDSLDAAQSDLKSLAGSEVMKRITDLANIDVKSYGSFMSSPVDAQLNQVYPLNSYGSGVAPFYTNLAIWVGCFMLIAVLKLEADPKLFPKMRPWQGYVGRLMLFMLLAILQGIVVTVGDMVLGVQVANGVALVAAGAVVAFCFINIVYAMAITLKHVGKALAVVFLIVQIPGASGMYPIQLMPEFFQTMYPWLPFTYGMDAMREAVGGFYGFTYAYCLVWLLAAGLAALAIALIVRPRLLNLNRLFDRKLSSADLYITEEYGLGVDVSTDRPVIDTLLADDDARERMLIRVVEFAQRYNIVRQVAPLAIVVLTACLGVVSMIVNPSVEVKLIVLSAFIVAVVAIFCACVAFEYLYDNMSAKLREAGIDIEAMHAGEVEGGAGSAGAGVGSAGAGVGAGLSATAVASAVTTGAPVAVIAPIPTAQDDDFEPLSLEGFDDADQDESADEDADADGDASLDESQDLGAEDALDWNFEWSASDTGPLPIISVDEEEEEADE